jgi:hypothetical protein
MIYRFDNNKKNFLEAYEKSLGNISHACKKANISRQSYYNWVKDDGDFAEAVRAVNEQSVDTAETVLKELIVKEKNVTAVIFYLKTKGRDRGYGDQAEINLKGKVTLPWKDEPI